MVRQFNLVVQLLLAVTAIAGCSSGSGSASANQAESINWQSCDNFAESEFQCATVTVPLDYNNPLVGNTYLHVVKYQKYPTATSALFFNSGGPWGSSTQTKTSFTRFSDEILKRYSIINFDPRGVGLSSRINDCTLALPATGGSIMEQSNFIPAFSLYQSQLSACFNLESNNVKYYMGTTNTAKDMDHIRQLVGYSQISFLGYSYGTQLGSVYLSLFPDNIDKMILDGNMNPDHNLYYLMVTGAGTFTLSMQYLLESCNNNPSCVLYPDASQKYRDFINQINAGLVYTRSGQPVILDDFYAYLVPTLQSLKSYPEIMTVIKYGLDTHIFNYKQPVQKNISGHSMVYSLVMTSDMDFTGLSTYQDAMNLASLYWNKTSFDSYVVLSNDPANENLFRSYSSLPNNPLAPLVYPDTVPAALIIGNYYDPSTGYDNSLEMNAVLPNSVLLSFNGGGHCAYNVGVSQCINNYANAYLLNGAESLPPVGTVCNDAINPSSPVE